ncbi:MAG: DegT/DnrJ/EryC1/StrS family aminotransferase [Ignavibacteria bacterium]
MKIPFMDLRQQNDSVKNETGPAIQNIIDNSSFILGKSVTDFENDFAAAHDVKHCIGVSSGTDGNHLALWANGIKANDEVIIPANTFIATAWGITLCGAKPVFVDCQNDSYNIDPVKIEEKITPDTKAIVAVHLYGQPADLDPIKQIADKHNILLIEDAAQAHLAEYKSKKVGGLSSVCSFSFYPGKNLGAFGESGAVTTNNDALALKVRMYRDHGSVKKYYHETFGHNYRMEGIQGAVLGIKLKHLDNWTNKRRDAAKKYNDCLKDISEIILPKEMSYAKHVYHLYVIQTDRRDELQKYLNDNGVSTGMHYPVPLHIQECFQHLGYKKGDFPVTEKLADSCISLPLFPEMTDEQIEYVSDKIKHFFTL